jgi:predicted transcriptional regulator
MVRISVEVPDELAEALTARAAALRLSEHDVMRSALEAFLDTEPGLAGFMADRAAFEAWIAEGEADIAAGRTVSFEEALAEIDAIIAKAQAARG